MGGFSGGLGRNTGFGNNVHVVRPGEVLSRIARRHGTSVNAIAQRNKWLLKRSGKHLRGVDYIRPGDPIHIPRPNYRRPGFPHPGFSR